MHAKERTILRLLDRARRLQLENTYGSRFRAVLESIERKNAGGRLLSRTEERGAE